MSPGGWDARFVFVTIVGPGQEKGAMPPKNKGERLTGKEVRTVAQWVHEGAKIDGEKGKKGSDELDPEKILKFKDGRIVPCLLYTRPSPRDGLLARRPPSA